MTVNEEVTNVNMQIALIDESIENLNAQKMALTVKKNDANNKLQAGISNLNKLKNVDLPYCDQYLIKAKREACKSARNSDIISQANINAIHQNNLNSVIAQIAQVDAQITQEENSKTPLLQQLNLLKSKQGAENDEREILAAQGTSWTELQTIAEGEKEARILESEITANANAEVIALRGKSTIDEEEEALRIKNEKQKALMWIGIAIGAVVLIIGSIFLIKKFKKKGAK